MTGGFNSAHLSLRTGIRRVDDQHPLVHCTQSQVHAQVSGLQGGERIPIGLVADEGGGCKSCETPSSLAGYPPCTNRATSLTARTRLVRPYVQHCLTPSRPSSCMVVAEQNRMTLARRRQEPGPRITHYAININFGNFHDCSILPPTMAS